MGEFEQKLNNKILEYGTTAKTAKKLLVQIPLTVLIPQTIINYLNF